MGSNGREVISRLAGPDPQWTVASRGIDPMRLERFLYSIALIGVLTETSRVGRYGFTRLTQYEGCGSDSWLYGAVSFWYVCVIESGESSITETTSS